MVATTTSSAPSDHSLCVLRRAAASLPAWYAAASSSWPDSTEASQSHVFLRAGSRWWMISPRVVILLCGVQLAPSACRARPAGACPRRPPGLEPGPPYLSLA